MVPVLDPLQGQRIARELSDGALVVIKGPGLNSVVIAAAILTAILAIPIYGTWLSVIAFTLGASAYGEILRRVSSSSAAEPDPIWWESLLPRSIPKGILCLLFAAGTVVPFWILNAAYHQSPHWDSLGGAITVASWTIVPLLMLGYYGQSSQETRLGFRLTLKVLIKHPFATLLALAVIPTTLILAEVALDLILYMTGTLAFYALDFMPMPRTPHEPMMYDAIPHYNTVDFRNYEDSKYIIGYFDNVRRGYSFVGAIPASLANSTRAELNLTALRIYPWLYFSIRLLITMVIVTCLLTAFAIQARWLGVIPALTRIRPASTTPQPPALVNPAPLT